ncbi:SRPBCC family protein [Nesterenkonia xinjiangensis]|uniref:Carbon monoxide dehydrogenase subunit G n=1 Tax=Nesterenkonia xinjiangensis TaxID=225327 RepID=A0A7Z0GM10_9MICC|nr:SRPBCC family protein [Nesterenkonia xinjiangensis]NYJ78385.1 carbon monoxide dehydrogenase subunit G [Nesterenkonia xinjiangensis]
MDEKLELCRQIDAPGGEVWSVLTDLDGAAQVLSGVTRIERLAGTGAEVGARWRETRRMMGTQASEEMEIVASEPERRLQVAAASHGMSYETAFILAPRGRGTLLCMSFHGASVGSGRMQRAAAALTAPLGRLVTRSAMRRDLRDIATAAEAHAAA